MCVFAHGCAIGTGRSIRPRAELDESGPFTVAMTGAPIRTNDTIQSFEFWVSSVPAEVAVLVFTRTTSTSISANISQATSPLLVKHSALVSIDSLSNVGRHTINVLWPVVAGDLIGFSVPTGVATIPFDRPEAIEGVEEREVRTPVQWIVKWNEARGTGAMSFAPAVAAERRIYSFLANLQSDCTAAVDNSGVCGVAPTFRTGAKIDLISGVTTLLVGLAASTPDVLQSVGLVTNQLSPFSLQQWRRVDATYTLIQSVFIQPSHIGFYLAQVNWPLQMGDVIGWTTEPTIPGAIGFEEDEESHYSSMIFQFDNFGQTSVSMLHMDQLPTTAHRRYAVQLFQQVTCVRLTVGASSLHPLTIVGSPSRIVLLTGQIFNAPAYLFRLSAYFGSLKPVSLQLYSSTTSGGVVTYRLKHSQLLSPTALGYHSLVVSWPVQNGDVIGYSSVGANAAGVNYEDDATQSARAQVLVFSETAPSEGSSLTTTPVSAFRFVNIQAETRPYGVCSGAGTIPSSASIGTCGYLDSTSSSSGCSFACASGYKLVGSPLTCVATSMGALSGSQFCSPLPCTISLKPQASATLGTCHTTIESGVTCSVECNPGFVSSQPTTFTCTASKLVTSFVQCKIPQQCNLPVTLSGMGFSQGNCTAAGILRHHQFCDLELKTGYIAVDGSKRLSCFNGVLSLMPRILQTPCYLPDLRTNLRYGSCAPIIGSGEPTCQLECDEGYFLDGSAEFNCTRGILQGSMPKCTIAPSCFLPLTLPAGVDGDSCVEGGELSPMNGTCEMKLQYGYTLVSGSLTVTCKLGVLSQMPAVIETPCTLPSNPSTSNALPGGCELGSGQLESGKVCDVICKDGYTTNQSPSFFCRKSALTGKWPHCSLPACQLPILLPEGLAAGSCTLGGLLRNDGDQFPSSCQLALQPGYVRSSGSLALTCSRTGVLSAFPIITQTMILTTIQGDCVDGPANWAARTELELLPFAGQPVCPLGQAVYAWRFVQCSLPDSTSGLNLQIDCSVNVLLDSSSLVTTADSPCVTGLVSLFNQFGPLQCDEGYAVVGLGFSSCNTNGAQFKAKCRRLISQGNVNAEIALVGSDANPKYVWSSGNCRLSPPTNLLDLTDIKELPCPYSIYNYQRRIGTQACGDAVRQQQINGCILYRDSIPGLAAVSMEWVGASVQNRLLVDPNRVARCNVLHSERVRVAGKITSVRFWARDLGEVYFQTYSFSKKEYTVEGSFKYIVTRTGYHQVGIPDSETWRVTLESKIGFCYGNTAIIPYDESSFFFWPPMDDTYTSAHTITFTGPAVTVGEKVGGGDDAGSIRFPHRFYSFQFGLTPVDGDHPLLSFGSAVVNGAQSDTLTDGNCLLLDHPRIETRGRVKSFRFWSKSNAGLIKLQTYHEVPRYSGNYVLAGAYQVEVLKKGLNEVTLPENQQWDAEPGDMLAHCYELGSIAFDWNLNAIGEWRNGIFVENSFYSIRNNRVSLPTQHWLSYYGSSDAIGAGPGGGLVNGFYTHSIIINNVPVTSAFVERDYALEIKIVPSSACSVLSTTALNGHGTVSCSAKSCQLECEPGYGAAKPHQTCHADGSWDSQGTCVPIADPTFGQSWNLPDLDPYELVWNWSDNGLPTGVILLGWELTWFETFPANSDDQLVALSGLYNTSSKGIQSLAPTTTRLKLTTDHEKEIEHVGVEAALRMVVSGGRSPWIRANFSTPCACDMQRALEQEDPHNSVLFGWPLDLKVKQNLGIANNLMFTFTPNSLCSDSYQVTLRAKDGTDLAIPLVEFNVFHADNTKTCSFFHPTTQQVATVTYPMYGRELEMCLSQRPMLLCSTCNTEYGTGLSDGGVTPPPRCTRFKPSFFVDIAGQVTTQKSRLAPMVQGVGGVTITAWVTDVETLAPMLFTNEEGVLERLHIQTTTDNLGKYRFILSSDRLANREYGVHVEASKVDYDAAAGIHREHVFENAADNRVSAYDHVHSHAAYVPMINFFDLSVVPILGSVLLSTDPMSTYYGSNRLQGCGVFNITITVYAESDLERINPLANSTATLNDGLWQVTAPMMTTVILVPSQAGVNRTFNPPFIRVKVKQSLVQTEPIFDETVSSFQLMIDGGNCGFHVGSVRPTLFMDSCGPSANILLPPFADGVGYTYTLPAQRFTIKLFDSKNPFSGLQGVDLDGSILPNDYLNGDLFNFIALGSETRPFNADFSNDPTLYQSWHFRYFALPDLTPSRELFCEDGKAISEVKQYDFVKLGGAGVLSFKVTETYGYVPTNGDDRRSVCGNVTSSVEFLDGVTGGEKLLQEYIELYGCSDGNHLCVIPTVFNEKDRSTSVTYLYSASLIQESDFRTDEDDVAHTQPAYTRTIQYRLGGSVFPFTPYYVLVIGTSKVGGSMSLVYPPWDALYILRDPPGGGSTASLATGKTLSAATSLSLASSNNFNSAQMFHIGGKTSNALCIGGKVSLDVTATAGAMLAACGKMFEFSFKAVLGTVVDKGNADTIASTNVQSVSFVTGVTTSADPNLIDGDGDLFLTIDGTFSLTLARTISIEITPSNPGPNQKQTCKPSSKPSVAWSQDKGSTYQWVSQWDIKNRLIKDLELTNRLMLENVGVSTVDQLMVNDPVQGRAYQQNIVAIAQWEKLLAHNQQLKDEAVPWTDFYEGLTVPGRAQGDSKSGIGGLTEPTDPTDISTDMKALRSIVGYGVPDIPGKSTKTREQSKGFTTSENMNRFLSNQNFVPSNVSSAENKVSSITFYGDPGGSGLTFTMTATSDSIIDRTVEGLLHVDVLVQLETENVIGGFLIGGGTGFTYSMEVVHGTNKDLDVQAVNEISVFLQDLDPGDMFHIEMWKDKMGSPVYKVKSGQSRCPPEAGTVSREAIELIVGQPVFTHIHPNAVVSTTLTLQNKSPTQETFVYNIVELEETNRNGLKLYINGQVLNSFKGLNSDIQVEIPYGVNLVMTLVAMKGEAAYQFDDIGIRMQSEDESGDCVLSDKIISIGYDQPCNQVKFAGPLAVSGSFTVNYDNILASSTRSAVMGITIYNPEFTIKGRRFKDMIETGYLTEVEVQYRPAGSPGDILSEADWQPVKRVGAGVPAPPLLELVQKGIEEKTMVNDFLSFTWDMASLADGRYQLRALTQCAVPSGALDTALYTFVSPIIPGTVDVIRPKLFGDPLPGIQQWYPGQTISASLTKKLACNSYYGKTRVESWLNPGLVRSPQKDGKRVETLYLCKEETIFIQFYAPIYDDLVGRLVTMHVDRLYDTSGNSVQGDFVEWSFVVAPFNAKASTAEVIGMQLNVGLSWLLVHTEWRSIIALQRQLSDEISTIVNSAIDTVLAPTPRASTSINGLQPGSAFVGGVTSAENGAAVTFRLAINQLPSFPGDAPLPYSPSFFANYLLQALNNRTYADNRTYPLLSYLEYELQTDGSSSLTISVFPVASGPGGSTETFALKKPMHLMSTEYTLSSIDIGLNPSSASANDSTTVAPSATVQISWLVTSSSAPLLSITDAEIEYELVPDANSDPDDAASVRRVALLPDDDVNRMSLVSNLQPTQNRALYSLQIVNFPTVEGGANFRFFITVRTNDEYLYTVDETTFVVGPPTPPVLLAVNQPEVSTITAAFYPTRRRGTSSTPGDQDIKYQIQITTEKSAAAVVIPGRFLSFTRSMNPLGVPTIDLVIDLAAASQNLSLALPKNGNSAVLVIGVIGASPVTSSTVSSLPLTVASMPDPIAISRIAQSELGEFVLRFRQPNAEVVLSYTITYEVWSLNGTRATGEEVLAPSEAVIIQERGVNSALLPLLSYRLRVQPPDSGYASLSVAISVATPIGKTVSVYQPVYQPAYISPPRQLSAVALNQPFKANQTVNVKLTWNAPEIIRPSVVPLLKGFQISYCFGDGFGLLSAEIRIANIDVTSKQNQTYFEAVIGVPYIPSPVSTLPTMYSFFVCGEIFSSDNMAIIYRQDGSGLQIIQSSSVSTTLSFGPPKGSASGISADVRSTTYPLEGPMNPLAPRAPLDLKITRLNQLQVRVMFPVSLGATSYLVTWYNASQPSTMPLGMKTVSAQQQVDGTVIVLLQDQLVPPTPLASASFKIAVAAVNEMGASQRIVDFITIAASVSSDASYTVQLSTLTDAWPTQFGPYSGWSADIPLASEVTLQLFPSSRTVRAVQAIFLHTLLADIVTAFPSCHSPPSTSTPVSGGIVTLTSCSDYAATVYPVVSSPNIVYLKIIAEDFSVHYSAIALNMDTTQANAFQPFYHTMSARGYDSHVHMHTFLMTPNVPKMQVLAAPPVVVSSPKSFEGSSSASSAAAPVYPARSLTAADIEASLQLGGGIAHGTNHVLKQRRTRPRQQR